MGHRYLDRLQMLFSLEISFQNLTLFFFQNTVGAPRAFFFFKVFFSSIELGSYLKYRETYGSVGITYYYHIYMEVSNLF